jgi:hypothetical protein
MLRERVAVLERIAEYSRQHGKHGLADRYDAEGEEAKQAADVMRGLLFPA